MPNFRTHTEIREMNIERLISAANFMLDVLDYTPFYDSSGLRLHEQHTAYCKLKYILDEVVTYYPK